MSDEFLAAGGGHIVLEEDKMNVEPIQCGKRAYIIESRITKNGHKYLMITEKSFGRMSKVMVFHDHYELFRSALERAMESEPLPASAAVPSLM